MAKLTGKVAIVTGASRGIGRAIALALAEEGVHLALAAKTIEPNPKLPGTLGEVRDAIVAKGGRAIMRATDVRDETQVQALVDATVSELGGVDILINNAGALFWAPIEETPAKRFDLVVGVNVRASFVCSAACMPHMKKRGGHIINMSPPITEGCMNGRTAYMISKFGMSMLTEGLAAEGKPHGIKSHALWPVTMVESQATIGNHLGEPSMWRTPQIIVDALVALLTGASAIESGKAAYDEDVLRSVGVSDFAKYACVPGTNPPGLRLDDPKSYWRQ